MSFFVYDIYDTGNFFKKVTNFFIMHFTNKMSTLLKNNKRKKIIDSKEYKEFSIFLCNYFSKCPCDCKSVILSNKQIEILLSQINRTNASLAFFSNNKKLYELSLLFEIKFYSLKTADFDFLFAIDDMGKIENFASTISRLFAWSYRNNQTNQTFFDGIIDSLGLETTIHYIGNEAPNSGNASPDYNNFSTMYYAKKGTHPTYCSINNIPTINNVPCNCQLLNSIN